VFGFSRARSARLKPNTEKARERAWRNTASACPTRPARAGLHRSAASPVNRA